MKDYLWRLPGTKVTHIKRVDMREANIEAYFVSKMKVLNSWQRKFTSPTTRGVPDRVANIHNVTVFIEFKAPNKKTRLTQQREHKKMMDSGAFVYVIDSIEGVDKLLAGMVPYKPQ